MSRLGPYTLVRRLAVGGMAEIFLARRDGPAGFAKVVALKKILPHLSSLPDFVDMFLDEARIAARLSHPNIVQIYDFGEADGSHFLAMEYVPGEDLLTIIRKARDRGRPVPPVLAASILAAACDALDHAHGLKDERGAPLGIAHRDVTPSNLIVSFDGVVKLADFGIAKAESKVSHTVAGALKGKYSYMSPEQVTGAPTDRRSDVFSLGVVAFELVTGQRLFHREGELAVLKAVTSEAIPHPKQKRPDLPDDLDAIIMRALDRNPAERWPTAQKMQLALEDFMLTHASAGSKIHLAQFMRELFGADVVASRQRWAAGDFEEGESTSLMPIPPRDAADLAAQGSPGDLPAAQTIAETPQRARRTSWFLVGALALFAAAGAIYLVKQRREEPPVEAGTSVTVVSADAPAMTTAPKREPDAGVTAAPVASPPADAPPPDAAPPDAPAIVIDVADKNGMKLSSEEKEEKKKKKKEPSYLSVEVKPAADVLLDGERLGSGPVSRKKIDPGRHTITLVGRDEGGRVKISFTVKPGEEKKIVRTLAKGKLAADAQPWAEVYSGGHKLGTTPLAPLALTEGTYTLRFYNPPQKKEKTVTVRVKPGKLTRVKETLD